MNKTNLALASLTAAIPAGVLAFLLVSTFLSSFEVVAKSGILAAVSVLTLALGAIVTLMPVGILIFGPKTDKPEKKAPSKASQAAVAKPGSADELSEVEMEAADMFSDSDMEVSDAAFELDEIDEDEVVVADDDDLFEDEVSGEFEDFDFEDDEKKNV